MCGRLAGTLVARLETRSLPANPQFSLQRFELLRQENACVNRDLESKYAERLHRAELRK